MLAELRSIGSKTVHQPHECIVLRVNKSGTDLAEPGGEVGVTDGGEEDPESDLHAFGRVDLHVLHDEGLAGSPDHSSCKGSSISALKI